MLLVHQFRGLDLRNALFLAVLLLVLLVNGSSCTSLTPKTDNYFLTVQNHTAYNMTLVETTLRGRGDVFTQVKQKNLGIVPAKQITKLKFSLPHIENPEYLIDISISNSSGIYVSGGYINYIGHPNDVKWTLVISDTLGGLQVEESMSLKDAYFFVYDILKEFWDSSAKYWDKKDNTDFATLLSDMSAIPDPNSDRLYTSNPAVWDAWVNTLNDIAPEGLIIERDALKAAVIMFENYEKQGMYLPGITETLRQKMYLS